MEEPALRQTDLLSALPTYLNDAAVLLPSASFPDTATAPSIIPPPNGISLLDTKIETFLSYLHTVAFFILLRLQECSAGNADERANSDLHDAMLVKLAELRVHLERGVKPLEGRLKYQVDKVLKTAEQSVSTEKQRAAQHLQQAANHWSDASDEESESEEVISSTAGPDADEDEFDNLAHRPNVAALSRALPRSSSAATNTQTKRGTDAGSANKGVYRPPKIQPVALPDDAPTAAERRTAREARHTAKSAVIDEFVQSELSNAPIAEPSIGTTIRAGGRAVRSERERERERERTEYEETNYVRLPKESKKERRAAARRAGGAAGAFGRGYGGEDWRVLGEGADRIAQMTRRSKHGGDALLDRSRKRSAVDEGSGVAVGERFDKRRKKIASWKK